MVRISPKCGTVSTLWHLLCLFWFLLSSCRAFQGTTLRTGTKSVRPQKTMTSLQVSTVGVSDTGSSEPESKSSLRHRYLIHWRGEKSVSYSKPFRHLELTAAISAALHLPPEKPLSIDFVNALEYTGQEELKMDGMNLEDFNDAMQYLDVDPEYLDQKDAIIEAVKRSSLVHGLYEIVAVSDSYEDLAPLAIENGAFQDLYKGSPNEEKTWCFRVRSYNDMTNTEKDKRYGTRARSMSREKEGLAKLRDLLILFGGKVNLLHPDCKIYVFDGLDNNKKVLCRRIATGATTSSIAPCTRICITTTPLCPIASFSLCNVAQIQEGSTILDPYSGSGAILLAAAMIAPICQTVGIEIAHSGHVNRDDILKDFDTRGLSQPKDLIWGDSTAPAIRSQARAAIGNKPFDCIITDPPYGIREAAVSDCDLSPMEQLFTSIALDREAGTPLLKKGGRLVAFVPVTDEQTLTEMLPVDSLADEAGLRFEVSREQLLNTKLSRWLVSYVCTR